MYKSCNIILHGLCFFSNMLVSCCFSPNDKVNGGLPPVLYEQYKGEIIPKDELFRKIREYSDQFKNGSCPKECLGCFRIEEKDWDESEYIDYITITHYSTCNADCVYCSNNLEPEERTNDTYEVLPFLRYLKNEGVLKEGMELCIGGGEFTIYKECEDILKEFCLNNFAKLFVATNAIKYSENLHKSIEYGSANVLISLDSGCRETFKKIKRVDSFNKVVENLKKYASFEGAKDRITLKYIIIPGMNDNIGEFKKFIKIIKSVGLKRAGIDIDCRYLRHVNNKINPFYVKLAKKMKDIGVGMDCDVYFHTFMQQALAQEKNGKSYFQNLIDYIKLRYFTKSVLNDLYINHKYQ